MNQEQELSRNGLTAVEGRCFGVSPLATNTGQWAGGSLPLSLLGTGTCGRVSQVRGPSDMVRRMTELGFVEGTEVKVVSGNYGSLIIDLKGSRLAIGRQMASHIVVAK